MHLIGCNSNTSDSFTKLKNESIMVSTEQQHLFFVFPPGNLYIFVYLIDPAQWSRHYLPCLPTTDYSFPLFRVLLTINVLSKHYLLLANQP